LAIWLTVSIALCDVSVLVAWILIPTCLSIRLKEEMPRAMVWISTSVSAISAPTALRIRDSRKPAPATPIIEAITLLAE